MQKCTKPADEGGVQTVSLESLIVCPMSSSGDEELARRLQNLEMHENRQRVEEQSRKDEEMAR